MIHSGVRAASKQAPGEDIVNYYIPFWFLLCTSAVVVISFSPPPSLCVAIFNRFHCFAQREVEVEVEREREIL